MWSLARRFSPRPAMGNPAVAGNSGLRGERQFARSRSAVPRAVDGRHRAVLRRPPVLGRRRHGAGRAHLLSGGPDRSDPGRVAAPTKVGWTPWSARDPPVARLLALPHPYSPSWPGRSSNAGEPAPGPWRLRLAIRRPTRLPVINSTSALTLAVHALFLAGPLLTPLAIVAAWRRRHDRDTQFLSGLDRNFLRRLGGDFFAGSARYLLPMAAPVAILASWSFSPFARRASESSPWLALPPNSSWDSALLR